MKNVRKMLVMLIISVMLMCFGSINVFATTTTQDGLEATLTTDKSDYGKDDKISVTVAVKNTNADSIENVSLEAIVPNGYTVADNSSKTKNVGTLKSGETSTLEISYIPVKESATEENVVVNTISANTVNTGDTLETIFMIIGLLGVSGGLIVFLMKNKKAKAFLSLLLIVSIFGSSSLVLSFKTYAVDNKNIDITTSVNIENSSLKINAKVYYNEVSKSEYTVSFDLNYDGASNDLESQVVKANTYLSNPPIPNRDGYQFIGWFLNNKESDWENSFDFINTQINKDIVLYALWVNIDEDTDSDGLPNWLEEKLETDIAKEDTDGDGLSDYFEYVNAITDPKIADTDGNGVPDFDEDSDEDGLKNGDEQIAGTYAFNKDSDNDSLTDGDEVHKYSTDPMKKDTDGDGLTDYEEIMLGLNPLKTASNGSVNDAERKLSQTASDKAKDKALIESGNWLVPQLSGNVAGLLDNQVSMRKDESLSFNDNHSILSDVIEIDSSCSSALNLEFTFKENYTGNPEQLVIAYYDNDAHELHLIDSHLSDEKNKLEGEITSSGYYFVMDIDEFLKSIGIDVMSNITESFEGISTKKYMTPIMYSPKVMAASTDTSIGKADIVFVVDTTDSMADVIYNVQNNINTFADKMSNEYHVDMNYSLIEYRDIEEDGVDSTIAHTNLSSRWFTNVNTFKSEVSNLTVDGGGDDPETPIDALELARTSNWRNSATRFVVLVTDIYSKDDNTSGIKDMAEMAQKFASDGIVVSVITDNRSGYASLLDQTNGLYGYIYSDFSDILLQLAGIIGTETHESGDWIILDDYSIVQLKGSVNDIAILDSDNDGLKDSEELIGKTTIDVKPLVMVALALHGVPMEQYIGKTTIEVWKFKSNPTIPDTDHDGLDDLLDNEPRNWFKHAFVIYETDSPINEAYLQEAKKTKKNSTERPEDFRYADLTQKDLQDMMHIYWGDFLNRDYFGNWKRLTKLASIGEMQVVALEMMNHFVDGTGSDFHNSILSKKVDEHKQTKTYTQGVEECLRYLLSDMGTSVESLRYANHNDSLMVQQMRLRESTRIPPRYEDWVTGLGITVDNLYGNRIEISAFESNGNHYKVKLHYVLYDIYGLDSGDIGDGLGKRFDFGILNGFRHWYILQHWDKFDGQNKPFISFMEFDREFEGDF